jgi:hypothetical protein
MTNNTLHSTQNEEQQITKNSNNRSQNEMDDKLFTFTGKYKWQTPEDDQKDVINFYFEELLKDKTGKYFFISKRRVKWFLLKKVHLDDCTLTYKKLWDETVRDNIINELEYLSNNIKIYDRDGNTDDELLKQIKKDNLEKYKNDVREELDKEYNLLDDNLEDNTDYTKFRETFKSFYENGSTRHVEDEIYCYLDNQCFNVSEQIGDDKKTELNKIRYRFNDYSKNKLTIFDMYRMNYVL